MKEPNLNAMLDFLFDLGKELEKDNNDSAVYNVYEVVSKMQGRDVEKEIAQLLYFCSEERAATVENELSQVEDPQKQNNIFMAIVTLYPLTKNIVVQLLKKADVQPSDFLNIYDNNSELLKIIKTNVKWVKDNSAYTNVDVNHYNEQLNKTSTTQKILLTTGATNIFGKQNIFDLAGNVWEWTLEYSGTTNPCTIRGGAYESTSSENNANTISNSYATFAYYSIGFRVSIY